MPPLTATSPSNYAVDQIFAVDVRAVFLASQAAARHMARIITIGSARCAPIAVL
jgi:NAD(P)-dependent dehydrogenase (short-subunit alcohol dehydrogenase family)